MTQATKTRLIHLIAGAIAGAGATIIEVFTTSSWAHAAWGPGALVFISWLVSEAKSLTVDPGAQK